MKIITRICSWLSSINLWRKSYWFVTCRAIGGVDLWFGTIAEGGLAEFASNLPSHVVVMNAVQITKADYLAAKKIMDEKKKKREGA